MKKDEQNNPTENLTQSSKNNIPTPKHVALPQKASSHMLWFFVVPAIAFIIFFSFMLVSGLESRDEEKPKKEQSVLILSLDKIENAKSSGDRWQAAYTFAEEVHKINAQGLPISEGEESKIFQKISTLLKQHREDKRLVRYLILTLGYLETPQAIPVLSDIANDESQKEKIRFFAAFGLLKTLTAHPSSIDEKMQNLVGGWLDDQDEAFRKIASSFLVQHALEKFGDKIYAISLEDESRDVRWNAAVALATQGDKRVTKVLSEMFNLKLLRSLGIKSSKDLEQLVATAYEAAVKLDDHSVLAQAQELRNSVNGRSPEGRAIHKAIPKI